MCQSCKFDRFPPSGSGYNRSGRPLNCYAGAANDSSREMINPNPSPTRRTAFGFSLVHPLFSFTGHDRKHTLSLHASGSVSAGQGLNLFSGYQVEIAGDGVLQRGSRHTEFQSRLEVLAVQHTADDAARKGVAAAHTVNDRMNAVLLGVVELLGISGVNACRPAVVGCGMLTRREDTQYSKL